MFIILVYDVHKKRVNRIHKICKKYLYPIQRSVFEGNITQKQLSRLKGELDRQIEYKEDAVCIYQLKEELHAEKLQLGIIEMRTNII